MDELILESDIFRTCTAFRETVFLFIQENQSFEIVRLLKNVWYFDILHPDFHGHLEIICGGYITLQHMTVLWGHFSWKYVFKSLLYLTALL